MAGLNELQGSSQQSLLSIPCYWDALSVGLATSVAVGLHRYRGSRAVFTSVDWAVKALTATSLATFAACRISYHQQSSELKENLAELDRRRRGVAGSDRDGATSSPSSNSSTSTRDE
mmetsp:Transcript_10033/g.17625  ORF Transcript_10033/g.17625 Transcript_10033/m.17625 type:complete len:117 (+) Transcript_10033:177-527(+)